MMDIGMKEIEELTVCALCKQKFNQADSIPKLLSCRHYFCLGCIKSAMLKGHEVFCINCWKRTELTDQDPILLPTYHPALALANNFLTIKQSVTNNNNVATSTSSDANGNLLLTNGICSPDIKRSETCQSHVIPLSLWCQTCSMAVCRACTSQPDHAHTTHQLTSQLEVTEKLTTEIQIETMAIAKLVNEIQRLVGQRRLFLLKVLEACVTIKTHIETDLQSGASNLPELDEARNILNKTQANITQIEGANEAQHLYSNLSVEKKRLQQKCHELYQQCHMNYLIKNSSVVFDFSLMKHVLESLNSPDSMTLDQQLTQNSPLSSNPLLILGNYCTSQLYSKHIPAAPGPTTMIQSHPAHMPLPSPPYIQQNGGIDYQPHSPPILSAAAAFVQDPNALLTLNSLMQHTQSQFLNLPRNLSPLPVYFLNIEVNSVFIGRILIEIRPDVAPKMAKNFAILSTGELGFGYKGCQIFQCWEGESVITGDFELNNGRGGRSIYEEGFFVPDDTKLPAARGAVGMRRTQKKHDNFGMVGSQFRIILQEMRGFTAIFGHVVEGIELVEKIGTFGDQAGKPNKTIMITNCGKL